MSLNFNAAVEIVVFERDVNEKEPLTFDDVFEDCCGDALTVEMATVSIIHKKIDAIQKALLKKDECELGHLLLNDIIAELETVSAEIMRSEGY